MQGGERLPKVGVGMGGGVEEPQNFFLIPVGAHPTCSFLSQRTS